MQLENKTLIPFYWPDSIDDPDEDDDDERYAVKERQHDEYVIRTDGRDGDVDGDG